MSISNAPTILKTKLYLLTSGVGVGYCYYYSSIFEKKRVISILNKIEGLSFEVQDRNNSSGRVCFWMDKDEEKVLKLVETNSKNMKGVNLEFYNDYCEASNKYHNIMIQEEGGKTHFFMRFYCDTKNKRRVNQFVKDANEVLKSTKLKVSLFLTDKVEIVETKKNTKKREIFTLELNK